jgi:hypothetical protein
LKRLLLPFIFCCSAITAQTFDLEQIEQIFRPRIKWDTRFILDSPFSDTTGKFSDIYSNAVVTFPIKSKLDASLSLDLSKPNLKDILKNSIRIKASQTLGSVRLGFRQTSLGFDSIPVKNLYSLTAGFMGVKLDKNYRIVFYNLSLNISEENKTLNQAVPRLSGVLGRLHLKGLRKNYYYGIALVYSDGLPLPVPFFGGSQPISKHFILNYTIPAQLNIQYKNGNTSLTLGGMADGFRSGIRYQDKRVNINHTAGQAYLLWKQKLGKTVSVRLEGGYYFYSVLSYDKKKITRNNFPVQPGPYVNIGINALFGQSLFEKVLDKITN